MAHGSFSWVSEVTTVATNKPILYIKNTDVKTLALSMIIVGSSVDNKFTIQQVSGTAAGTTDDGTNHEEGDTPVNTSTIATSKGNAVVTGLTPGLKLLPLRCKAGAPAQHMFIVNKMVDETIYLKQNQDIAIYAAVVGDVEVCLCGAWVG